MREPSWERKTEHSILKRQTRGRDGESETTVQYTPETERKKMRKQEEVL